MTKKKNLVVAVVRFIMYTEWGMLVTPAWVPGALNGEFTVRKLVTIFYNNICLQYFSTDAWVFSLTRRQTVRLDSLSDLLKEESPSITWTHRILKTTSHSSVTDQMEPQTVFKISLPWVLVNDLITFHRRNKVHSHNRFYFIFWPTCANARWMGSYMHHSLSVFCHWTYIHRNKIQTRPKFKGLQDQGQSSHRSRSNKGTKHYINAKLHRLENLRLFKAKKSYTGLQKASKRRRSAFGVHLLREEAKQGHRKTMMQFDWYKGAKIWLLVRSAIWTWLFFVCVSWSTLSN